MGPPSPPLSTNLEHSDTMIEIAPDHEALTAQKERISTDMGEEASPYSWKHLKTKLQHACQTAKTGACHAFHPPLPTVLGLTSAAQPAISAFLNPSHSSPEDINGHWWRQLATGTKVESVISMAFSLYVNFPVGKRFIQDAYSKVRAHTRYMFNSFGHFSDNLISLILGLTSGLGAAVITFEAFLWVETGGPTIPIAFGGLSFVIASTSRYLGAKRVLSLIKAMFDPDAQAQARSVAALNHIRPHLTLALTEGENTLDHLLQRCINARVDAILALRQPLREDDYEDLFLTLVQQVSALEAYHLLHQHGQGLFYKKNSCEYVIDYTHKLGQVIFATVFGASAASVFMQKGFDGVNSISKGLAKIDLEVSLINIWAKRLIGMPSGAASGLLYGASAAEFPKLFFVTLPTYLYHHPKQILSILLLLVSHYYAPSSFQNVTTGVLKRDNHLLGLLGQNDMKIVLPYLARAGCGFVNILPALRELLPQPEDPNRPTVKDIVDHFSDPSRRRIKHATALQCSLANHKLSFFTQTKALPESDQVHLNQHPPIPSI